MSQPTVSGSSVKALCCWLADRGVCVENWCSEYKVDQSTLEDQDARVPLPALNALWEYAQLQLDDPAIGLHLGEWIDARQMGVIGHIIYNNRTLENALEQYVRLSALINEGVTTSFRVEGEEALVEYHCEPDYYHPANLERMIALAVTRARTYVSEKIYLVRVGFQHSRPDHWDEYERIFQCPIYFDQSHSYLSFHSGFLQFELPNRNPYLHQALTKQVDALLQKISFRRGVSQKVRQIVARRLSRGSIDAEIVAEKLHMSRHTLYRKLKQEGVSFQELVEQVRKEKALEYLRKKKYSLSEIAFLLGFSELSAFSRAFKRWTGSSPQQYRD